MSCIMEVKVHDLISSVYCVELDYVKESFFSGC